MKSPKIEHYIWDSVIKRLHPGEQIHIHHCKTGRNNDRLYIKRSEDGHYLLGYCHHCGASGRFNLTGSTDSEPGKNDFKSLLQTTGLGASEYAASETIKKYDIDNYECEAVQVPKYLTSDLSLWRQIPRDWITSYGITAEDCNKHLILSVSAVAPEIKRDIIVFTRFIGEDLVFTNQRNFNTEPKYVTGKMKDYKCHFPLGYGDYSSDKCLIVEDFISAVLMYNLMLSLPDNEKAWVLPLFGTNLTKEQMFLLIKIGVQELYIMLDNDNSIVLNQGAKLRSQCAPFFSRIDGGLDTINDTDPKNLTSEEREKKYLKLINRKC